MFRKKLYLAVMVGVMVSLIAVAALAATANVEGYSGDTTLVVTYPDNQTSCGPDGTITINGIVSGHPVTVFFQYVDSTGNLVNVGSHTFTEDGNVSFPYPESFEGTRSFAIALRDDAAGKMLKGFKWDVTCEPPPPPPPDDFAACTPGYWRNHLENWVGYSPEQIFNTVFGVNYFSATYTLEDGINQGGGGLHRVARFGVAGLLSAAHPDVNFPYTTEQVIAAVQAGNVDGIAAAMDNFDCPW
jgi:hypothetical protein